MKKALVGVLGWMLLMIVVEPVLAQSSVAPPPTMPPPAMPQKPLPPEIPKHSIVFNSLTAGQWNPLGAETRLRVGYRMRLFSSESIVFRENFIRADFETRLNPAFVRVGGRLSLQLLAPLRLWARYELRGYFGSFKQLQSFPNAAAQFDDDTLEARSDADLNYTPTGHEVTLGALVRAKVGPIAIVNDLQLYYFDMNLRNGDTVWYDIGLDNVLPGSGWALANYAMALWLSNFGLIAGVRYSIVATFYTDAQQGGAENLNSPTHRLGPIFGWVFNTKSRWFKKPAVLLHVAWWFNSRFRSGDPYVSQGVPTGVLIFRFSGDIWTKS
ncbi:MAG: hypothetical protein KC503_17600 [Myxococcales bacterium]|nr:hypothetical protein [Myxococcales bacterium]